MGTYIKTIVEVRKNGVWQTNQTPVFPRPRGEWETSSEDRRAMVETPFYWQSYGIFGFFADVRNRSGSVALAKARGLPEDVTNDALCELGVVDIHDGDSNGFYSDTAAEAQPLTVAERLKYASDVHGHSWLSAAELLAFDYDQQFMDRSNDSGALTSYREFLGPLYFSHLQALKRLGNPEDVRILFCFN